MNQRIIKWVTAFGFVAVIGSGTGFAAENKVAATQSKAIDREWVNKTISGWEEVSKKAANSMIDKYGLPNEGTESMLIWRDTSPWKRTIVYRDPVEHKFPVPHKDVLEQFVDMDVAPDKFDDLAAYDGSVIVERTKGEISARCDKEPMNFLAINLAKDVASGKKTVDQARQTYAKTAMDFMKGKKSPLTQKFQFDLAKGNTADPDQSVQMAGKSAE
jgi:hypothetical protein